MSHDTDEAAGHGKDEHLAHHFETPQQQYESGKLGMWIFLATEILLFSGLFCAYAVYRSNHPEIFVYAHQFLDKRLGGINTIVLICSSLTMAWAVRCAQINKRRGLIVLLSVTLACGFVFLGIKYVEYQQKWKHGLLWGKRFHPHLEEVKKEPAHGAGPATPQAATQSQPAAPAGAAGAQPPASATTLPAEVRSTIAPAPSGPQGLALRPVSTKGEHGRPEERPSNVQVFFSIYFAMTGLHALHVIAGMSIITWLLARSIKGHFSSEYFTPVDLGGLYWHLVDLIWIYLFPLLYLIT